MKNKFPAILALGLLTGPLTAGADLVQSATGAVATFRQCVSGETACDSVGPVLNQESLVWNLNWKQASNSRFS